MLLYYPKIKEMKLNKYRIKKAWECYWSNRKDGTNVYWSVRLAMWWFSAGLNFEADHKISY